MDQKPLLNRFKPLQRRGRGGFGTVDVAYDNVLRRNVAIKRIPLPDTTAGLPGIKEARIAAKLMDPHIVAVHDFVIAGNEALIIMEDIDGPTLAELMQACQELLDLTSINAIVSSVVQALECAHENQVLHLDIKPSNILIDRKGRVKVSDFGLAELAGTAGYNEPEGGTIGHMPPEQLEGEPVDERSDLWALAALTYQLLTGENPFYAPDVASSLATALYELPPAPSELRPGLDPAADEVILLALSADKDMRPESVTVFWNELSAHLGRLKAGRQKLRALVASWEEAGGGLMPACGDDGLSAGLGDDLGDGLSAGLGDDLGDGLGAGAGFEDAGQPHSAQRQSELARRARGIAARVAAAVGCGSYALLGASGLRALASQLDAGLAGGTAAGLSPAADAAGVSVVALAVAGAVALVGFLSPSLGVALAGVLLAVGLVAAGYPLAGAAALAALAAWWLLCGRLSAVDATVMSLVPLAAATGVPLAIPLLAGCFLALRRSVPLALYAAALLAALGALTSAPLLAIAGGPLTSGLALRLYGAPEAFDGLVAAFTDGATLLGLLGAALAAAIMSLVGRRRTQVSYGVAVFLAVGVYGLLAFAAPVMTSLAPARLAPAEIIVQLAVPVLVLVALKGAGALPDAERDQTKE
ncbi:MAG: serine/threonine protein kinase [Coriobacteriales bacterium]|jgi:hypothetical protein|nr:serine/threonine protein kinase [Coriobacteriales bacterium]